jgi:hypothetical protein
MSGRRLSILDHDGNEVAAGILSDDLWPDTTLHCAEVDVPAPPAAGDYRWQVVTRDFGDGAFGDGAFGEGIDAAGSCAFTVRTVEQPDHAVVVAVIDAVTQAPVAGAHVLLHPYRARSDDTGTVRLKVARGRYRLAVSGFHYIADHRIIEVAGDVAVRAELAPEPEGLDDYR